MQTDTKRRAAISRVGHAVGHQQQDALLLHGQGARELRDGTRAHQALEERDDELEPRDVVVRELLVPPVEPDLADRVEPQGEADGEAVDHALQGAARVGLVPAPAPVHDPEGDRSGDLAVEEHARPGGRQQ